MQRRSFFFFFFNDTATTEIYTLSLHDALPISAELAERLGQPAVLGELVAGIVLGSSVLGVIPTGPDDPLRPVIAFLAEIGVDRKSTRLNSSHDQISYAVFCLKKKKKNSATAER